jgi:hypothetical protein
MRYMRLKFMLVLASLVLAAPAAAQHEPKHPKHKRVTHSGTLVVRTAASVTVKRGDHTLTCSRDDSSPKVGRASVGDKVKVTCEHGVLVSFEKAFTGSAAGKISELSPSSVTLHNDDGTLTCTLAEGSPKLGDYHAGDKVKIACTNGVLTAIAKLTETTITTGVLSALSHTSVTVLSDGGARTCARGETPAVVGYNLGDRVKMTCVNGVLSGIAKVTVTTGTTSMSGVLSALSPTSLTVHTDGGDKTCSRTSSSPSLDGYQVGNYVKATCVDGALTAIAHL